MCVLLVCLENGLSGITEYCFSGGASQQRFATAVAIAVQQPVAAAAVALALEAAAAVSAIQAKI